MARFRTLIFILSVGGIISCEDDPADDSPDYPVHYSSQDITHISTEFSMNDTIIIQEYSIELERGIT